MENEQTYHLDVSHHSDIYTGPNKQSLYFDAIL